MRTSGIHEARHQATPMAPVPPAERPLLTVRELDVLGLLVEGDSNGMIAQRLGISPKTASVHVSNILGKLEAHNRVEAAIRAERLGLVASRPPG